MKVSIGVWLSGRMSAKDFAGYVVAQVIGAFAAVFHRAWFSVKED